MAKKRIDKNTFVDGNPFERIESGAKDAEAAVKSLEMASKVMTESAIQTKKKLSQANTRDAKSVKELEANMETANQTLRNSLKINEELRKEKIRLQEQRKKDNKELRETVALENKEIGTLEKLKIANAQMRREREKLNLETKEGQKRLKEINTALDANNAKIKKNSDQLKKQRLNVGNYDGAVSKLRGSLMNLGAAFGVAFGAREFISFAQGSIDLFREQAKAIAQVEAGLKSTGFTAQRTLGQLKKQASDLQKNTIFGDEQILKEATAQLLTFTNISGKQFDRTQEAALDLATRLDGDLKSASIQLGKALNDPVANLSALSRSGIQFSEEQKNVIKSLAESNQLAEAQTIILDELNKQYGGSAEAAAAADGGIQQLKNAIGDAREEFGKMVLEGLRPTIKSLKEFFENLKPSDIRRYVAQIKSAAKTILTLVAAYKAAKLVQKGFGNGLGDLNLKLSQLKTNLKNTETGLGNLRRALKTAVTAAVIAAFVQLGRAIWSAADGSTALNRQLAKIRGETDKILGSVNKRLEDRQDRLSRELALAGDNLKMRKQILNTFKEEADRDVENLKRKQEELKLDEEKIKKLVEQKGVAFDVFKATQDFGEGLSSSITDFQNFLIDKGLASESVQQLLQLRDVLEKNQAQQEAVKVGIEALERDYKDLNLQLTTTTTSYKQQGDAAQESADKQEKAFTKMSRFAAVERRDETRDTSGLDREKERFEAIAQLDRERIVRRANIALIEAQILGDEEAITEARINLINKELEAKIKSDIIKYEKGTLERQELEKQAELEILQLTKDTAQEQFEIQKQFIELTTELFTKNIDERISKINEQIKASEKQFDFLKQKAAEGSIVAEESLAAENQRIAQANAEKERLERRKQQILLVSTVLQSYNSNLQAGDDSGTAFSKAVTSTELIKQFVSALPGFFEGTENTGNNGFAYDEHGVITGFTHANERVMTAKDNAKLKGYSNSDVVAAVERDRLGGYASTMGNVVDNMQMVSELMGVRNDIKELNQTLKDKPVPFMEFNKVARNLFESVEGIKKGNTTTRNISKWRSK